jgi:RNA-directed DNA polymerase
VRDANAFLRGWAAYFKYGNSARRFGKIEHYALMRLALSISKRHQRSRGFGWSVLVHQSADQFGLISLVGTAVAPRPFRDWRATPNAGGERRR